MDENTLKELVKARKILKRKFQSIKLGEAETADNFEKSLKPLTEPLKTLVKLSQDEKRSSTTQKQIIPRTKYEENIYTSTPKKKNKIEFRKPEQNNGEDNEEEDGVADEDINNDTFYSQTDGNDLSYLEANNKLDKVYGPHKDETGAWKLGNVSLEVNNEKIVIGNQNWALTPGLYELLFYKNPSNYDESELEIYKKILINTNAHKRNFDPNGQLKGNRGNKYKKIISKIFNITHTGNGLMKVNPQKPNYIYWDDPNEIVERLKLLMASQHAGNNNQTNEIVSIIEELREADIIK